MNEPAAPALAFRLLLPTYLMFLVYATLYPFSTFRVPMWDPIVLLFDIERIGRADALMNVLVYLPLGWLAATSRPPIGSFQAALLGGALSLAMEYLQAFIPGRVPSVLDFGLNVVGTFLGAQLSARLGAWRGPGLSGALVPDPRARVGLMAFGTWAAAQLFPFVPSTDIGYLRRDLRPIAQVLRGQASFSWTDAAIHALSALCLASILRESLSPRRKLRRLVPLLLLLILLARIPIVTTELTLEAFLGAVIGLAVSRGAGTSSGVTPFLAAAGAFVLQELRAEALTSTLSPMNWVPLRIHLTDERVGAADILLGAWPFVALAFVASGWQWLSTRRAVFYGGGLVFLFALALEWAETYLPGRYPDVTDALVALAAWLVAWFEISTRRTSRPRTSPSPPP